MYVPISGNAGGIVEMVGMSPNIPKRIDAFDATKNTTAAIGSTGLVILAF